MGFNSGFKGLKLWPLWPDLTLFIMISVSNIFINVRFLKWQGTGIVICNKLFHNSLTLLNEYVHIRCLFPSYWLLMPINFFRD